MGEEERRFWLQHPIRKEKVYVRIYQQRETKISWYQWTLSLFSLLGALYFQKTRALVTKQKFESSNCCKLTNLKWVRNVIPWIQYITIAVDSYVYLFFHIYLFHYMKTFRFYSVFNYRRCFAWKLFKANLRECPSKQKQIRL